MDAGFAGSACRWPSPRPDVARRQWMNRDPAIGLIAIKAAAALQSRTAPRHPAQREVAHCRAVAAGCALPPWPARPSISVWLGRSWASAGGRSSEREAIAIPRSTLGGFTKPLTRITAARSGPGRQAATASRQPNHRRARLPSCRATHNPRGQPPSIRIACGQYITSSSGGHVVADAGLNSRPTPAASSAALPVGGMPPGSGEDAILEIDNLIRKVTNGAGREADR